MKPEKRERKNPEAFDPHPPGSKHKMMAERSKVTKGKKKDRERMRKVRGTDKKAVANEEAVEQVSKEVGNAATEEPAPEEPKKD